MAKIDLGELRVTAVVALDELKRYRGGEPMISVWPMIDDYTPEQQRTDARKTLCDEIVDMILKQEKGAE